MTPSRPYGFVEVFRVFLKLGLTSFGGPIAHLGYFRSECVRRRAWLSEERYAQLIALCQFLPGPASSQLGFSIGMMRAGWKGAVAAFLGFTLPSAVLMLLFATLLPRLTGNIGSAAIHGLKIVALAVVAHGVLGMLGRLCPDTTRKTIAAAVAVFLLLTHQAWLQLVGVAAGGLAGCMFCRDARPPAGDDAPLPASRRASTLLLLTFALLLFGLPLLARHAGGSIAVAEAFYRAGALVFGGGHVVLPLLEESVVNPGWVTQDEFLAGYGAAQAVPGPMFSFSAYLGTRIGGGWGAVLALVSIFLPGFLLVSGILPLWHAITSRPFAARAVAGVNAAVVGLLGAALYHPVWTSAVRNPPDLAIAVVGFTMLSVWRLSALYVVAWCVVARVLMTL